MKLGMRRAAIAAIAVLGFGGMAAHAQPDVKVGFVYVSPLGEAGWSYQHELGRQALEAALGDQVETRYVDNVSEGADAERVIREFASSGHDLVIATSFGYMNYVERVSQEFPDVQFLHATGYKDGANFANYNARFYEGRYLTGVIAGHMSETETLGYVAAVPIPEVVQGINAFTRGARSVNPDIEVRVIWTNSWYDPGREREAANTLLAQGADVLTHHTDSTAVVQAVEDSDRTAWGVGYHSDMSEFGPETHLTATTHHWGDYYIDVVESVIEGTYAPSNLWGGHAEGMIDIAPLNDAVPADVAAEIEDLQASMRDGEFHPFTGPVVNQAGEVLLEEGAVMSDSDLNQMNYFVEGVASEFPN
ncbi:BMP family ABC transporter substrate-binding protein [Spiribacter sp. C176]|uniref:BMP family ABC transporter substrate-binding protein n=1 Tax=Spiribacter salilacus TaxID=2664894 RepID=A0A6N7QPR5_9GAMM|nr:BMP family ABC transporter substrate-binding protein [Spiribacter salilacus]MRH77128.1 BMP family ABC transporter substrate-binding protein [Spiribacter salilacus]